MKRNIRNITIAFALTASITIGNIYMPTVFAEETAETEIEILPQEETESAEQEEIITAEMPKLEEEPVIFDETDETVDDSDMEEEQIVSGGTTETFDDLEESIAEVEEENIPVVEEDAEAGLTRSAISDSDYAYVQEIVSGNYPDRVIADSFAVSASGEVEYPASLTFDADVTADEDVLLIFVNGTDWNEIWPDSVADGSITATFYTSGAVTVVKNNEKTDEDIEDEQPGTEETEEVPFTYETAIDDIVVKIQADAGVFPADVTASVKKVYVDADIFAEENITETYSFDITMYSDSEEVQPDTSKGSVMVTFDQINIADDAEIDVYHVTENLQSASEKIQNIEVNNDGVSFEAEHFSVYTVIISTKYNNSLPVYVNLSYTLQEQIPLTEILDAAGYDYSDYIYISTSSTYSDSIEGQWYHAQSYSILRGILSESYIKVKNAGTISIPYLYLFKSDKSTKKCFSLYISIQEPQTHDFQLGENVFADFAEDSGKLTITGTGDMWSSCTNALTPIADQIKCIEIAEGITSIGARLFYGCSNITGNLVIPDSVTSIGEYAFYGCKGFDGTLTLSNNLVKINRYAFCVCKGLVGNLEIPDSVTDIGDYAFQNCNGFNGTLTLSSNLKTIGVNAFEKCSGLMGNLVIPDSVTSLKSAAFLDCSGFNGSLTISTHITQILDYTFKNCSGLTGDLIIPDNITSVGQWAFQNCGGFNGTLTLSTNLKTIGQSAFQGCSNLMGDLIIPDSVTSLGNYAFQSCSGFNGNLKISNSVDRLYYTFSGCSNLSGNLIIPNSILYINSGAFYNCSGFTGELNIPGSVTRIAGSAFYGCNAIDEITIPDSVTEIGSNAFRTTSIVRTRLHSTNEIATAYDWATSNRKLICDVTVTYHENDASSGAVPVDNTVYETDDIITVFGNVGMLEKDGLVFLGWNTASDGTGTQYKEGQTIIAEQSNIDLYAQFGNQPEEYTIKLPLELNMTVVENQFKGTADVAVDYYMESKKVNISVADFDMTDSTGDKITATGSVTGNGWHNGNTDATYDDADGLYHGVSHVTVTAPAKAGNYTGTMVFTISEQDI